MTHRRLTACLALIGCLLAPSWSGAQERALLYHQALSPELEAIATRLADLDTDRIPYAELKRQSDYYLRIAPRRYIIDPDGGLADGAILGTKPFVFVTTPQSVYGKPLLDIYLDIGYEAEDILRWQRDEDMVAIVFRWEDEVGFSPVRDGQLPEDWRQRVFTPTWDNVFALFHRLAAAAAIQPDQEGEFAPEQTFFRSEATRRFVLGFPAAGQDRIQAADYTVLRAAGGSDWSYRRLLETKLSIFQHFRGNGRTLNELIDPLGEDPKAGLLEFVGPNRKLAELGELAVVYLGRLTIEDLPQATTPWRWAPARGGQVPDRAVPAGREQAPGDEILYICRGRLEGGLHPGKIRPGFSGCNIGWGGREHTVAEYEVLVR